MRQNCGKFIDDIVGHSTKDLRDETYQHFATNTGVDASVIQQETLLMCHIEETSVSDGILGRSRDWETTPGIEMRIKVDNGDGAIDFVEGTKDGQNDGMITSEAVGPI